MHDAVTRVVGRLAVVAVISGAALMLVSLPGCEVASAAGDIAGSSYGAIETLVRAGKVERFAGASEADSIAAAERTAAFFQLKYISTETHPDQEKLTYTDERKQEVVITLVRRAGNMTEIHVDVGLFGPDGMSRLVLDRIAMELNLPAATQADTRPGA